MRHSIIQAGSVSQYKLRVSLQCIMLLALTLWRVLSTTLEAVVCIQKPCSVSSQVFSSLYGSKYVHVIPYLTYSNSKRVTLPGPSGSWICVPLLCGSRAACQPARHCLTSLTAGVSCLRASGGTAQVPDFLFGEEVSGNVELVCKQLLGGVVTLSFYVSLFVVPLRERCFTIRLCSFTI